MRMKVRGCLTAVAVLAAASGAACRRDAPAPSQAVPPAPMPAPVPEPPPPAAPKSAAVSGLASKKVNWANDTWIPVGLESEGIQIKEVRFAVEGGIHWNPLRDVEVGEHCVRSS